MDYFFSFFMSLLLVVGFQLLVWASMFLTGIPGDIRQMPFDVRKFAIKAMIACRYTIVVAFFGLYYFSDHDLYFSHPKVVGALIAVLLFVIVDFFHARKKFKTWNEEAKFWKPPSA